MTIHLLKLNTKLFPTRLPEPTANVSNHHNDSCYKPEDLRNEQEKIFQQKKINAKSSCIKVLGILIIQIE